MSNILDLEAALILPLIAFKFFLLEFWFFDLRAFITQINRIINKIYEYCFFI